MSPSEGSTTQIQAILDLAAEGQEDAYSELIAVASERLLKLTRKMLSNYPHLRRWEQTDDVFQNATVRLYRSLSEVKPGSVREFFGLAATQIRRTLIDLARHHFGPQGQAAKHETNAGRTSSGDAGDVQKERDQGDRPETLEAWVNFHDAVESLPPDEREVFSLVWYGGTTQREAADVLRISERTVIRRLNRARNLIRSTVQDLQPPAEGS